MSYILSDKTNRIVGPVMDLPAFDADGTASVELLEFYRRFGMQTGISTGILPVQGSGMVSYQCGGGFEQVVYQVEPDAHLVRWGARERDPGAKNYKLAQPYKVIIMDWYNGAFIGLRHFYAVNPVDESTQLYAINLPNTNTTGYSGTSIGWVCLYHNGVDANGQDLAERIAMGIHREGGWNEPYNDVNMSSTDGPRFYRARKALDFMWDPNKWQAKTLAEGIEWIRDEDLLIPLKVHNLEAGHAEKHSDHEDAVGYTLEMAMYGPYAAYYPNRSAAAAVYVKPFPRTYEYMKRTMTPEEVFGFFRNAVIGNAGAPAPPPPPPPATMKEALGTLGTYNAFIFPPDVAKFAVTAQFCPSCETSYPVTDGMEFKTVYTKYDTDNGPHEQAHWCVNCIENYAVKEADYNRYISTEELTWCDSQGVWATPDKVYTCMNCDMNWKIFGNSAGKLNDIIVKAEPVAFALNFEDDMCVDCAVEWDTSGQELLPRYEKCTSSGHFYLREHMSLVKTWAFDFQDGQPTTELVDTWISNPALATMHPCACGVPAAAEYWEAYEDHITSSEGQPVCVSCTHRGQYVPIITGGVSVSVSQS